MKIEIRDSYGAISKRAANLVAREIVVKEKPVLGLPTGDTPKRMYDILVNYYEEGLLDFSEVRTFNLDEYYPISGNDPRSFNKYMEDRLFEGVNIKNKNSHIFNGEVEEKKIEPHCRGYERKIADAGGIDLIVLGIGENGHIGFNEPGARFDTVSRVVELSKDTIEENFEDPGTAPERAITMGIKTITQSRKILLLASGEQKARAIKEATTGPVTREWPASVLQLHPDVTFLLDKGAGKGLDLDTGEEI